MIGESSFRRDSDGSRDGLGSSPARNAACNSAETDASSIIAGDATVGGLDLGGERVNDESLEWLLSVSLGGDGGVVRLPEGFSAMGILFCGAIWDHGTAGH